MATQTSPYPQQEETKYNAQMQAMQQALDNALAANAMLETVMASTLPVLFKHSYTKRAQIQAFIASAKSQMVTASANRARNIETIHRTTLQQLDTERSALAAANRVQQAADRALKAKLESAYDRKTGQINIEDANPYAPVPLDPDFFRD